VTEQLVVARQCIRDARLVLDGADKSEAVGLAIEALQAAEVLAGEVPSDLSGGVDAFADLVALRNELTCCLIAVLQVREAGVATDVVLGILRRGAETAEGMLDALTGSLERV